jgi:hypothetical protein
MGPWKKFESTIVRLKRSYENTGSVVCLTTKGRQLERNFEELKPASHVPILGTILNIFDVFVAVFFLSVKFFELRIVFFYTLLNNKNTQCIVNKQYCTKKNMS